jgi:hypothetical protein
MASVMSIAVQSDDQIVDLSCGRCVELGASLSNQFSQPFTTRGTDQTQFMLGKC